MSGELEPMPPGGEMVLYLAEDGRTRIECRFDGGTVWLPQRLVAHLYQVSVSTVNEHLAGIYAEHELEPQATIRKFRIVQTEVGRRVTRNVDHYNLAAI
jgi:hypothetical protein